MKLLEYIYLALAVGCLGFLVTEFNSLSQTQIALLFVAMGIFGFMFSFKRSQRIKFEQFVAEEEAEEEVSDLEDGQA
ncbi:hypothetical protein [Pontibacter sp. G13]|uniref:hypothetical protein n=1 Tax=Pontibacter sp. G13 TaxID=3074898 RepID=UPI00288A1482|nr:hypothetical protein [Pontibacter sp. G13]WNJ21271.1 hypothetical protein RJD25_12450 [Pontibacter sp. G13]